MPAVLWGRVKSFDVVSGSTQAPSSQYAFTFDLGGGRGSKTTHNVILTMYITVVNKGYTHNRLNKDTI